MIKLNSLFVSICCTGGLLGLLARRFYLMNEEFVTNVNELRVDNPRVNLMVKHLVAGVEDSRVHILDYWIASHTPLVESFEKLAAPDA